MSAILAHAPEEVFGNHERSGADKRGPYIEFELKDECPGGCIESLNQGILPTTTSTIDLYRYVPHPTSEVDGEVISGLHPATHNTLFRYTPTVTVTVPESTSSPFADTATTNECTTSKLGPLTTASSISSSTVCILDKDSEFTTSVGGKVVVGLHSTTSTSSKSSATFGIPEFVNEFTSDYEDRSWHGKHPPTGLLPPVSSTYIILSGGVSVFPEHGPIVFKDPSGRVTMHGKETTLNTAERAPSTTFPPGTTTIKNGPTVSVDATGAVSVLTALHSYPTTISSSSSISAVSSRASCSTRARSSITASSSPTTSPEASKIPALSTTLTRTYHTTETTTNSSTTAVLVSNVTGGFSIVPTSSTRSTVNVSDQPFTKTLNVSLPQASISSTLTGLTPPSLTTVTTALSAGPSTLLRLRRSAGHYTDPEQATYRRSVIARALETPLGTKDSSNLFYNEDTAATPYRPWGTARHAIQVFNEPKNFGGEISARLIGIVIGGIFGLVVVVTFAWWGFRKVQQRRVWAKGEDVRGEMAQR